MGNLNCHQPKFESPIWVFIVLRSRFYYMSEEKGDFHICETCFRPLSFRQALKIPKGKIVASLRPQSSLPRHSSFVFLCIPVVAHSQSSAYVPCFPLPPEAAVSTALDQKKPTICSTITHPSRSTLKIDPDIIKFTSPPFILLFLLSNKNKRKYTSKQYYHDE
jgi:hypothetical protein